MWLSEPTQSIYRIAPPPPPSPSPPPGGKGTPPPPPLSGEFLSSVPRCLLTCRIPNTCEFPDTGAGHGGGLPLTPKLRPLISLQRFTRRAAGLAQAVE